MAKKKKEKATEEVVKVDLSKKTETEDNITKVDLNKPIEPKEENETKEEVKENNADDSGVATVDESTDSPQEQEEVSKETEAQEEQPVLEEVTQEEIQEQTEELADEVKEAVTEAQETGKDLPENIQKLMEFMEETGGTLEDYVTLNQDFSKYDDMTILREYYKKTKSHLTSDEVDFLIEDRFSYDEEVDEEREIKKKKIALKEQVADAKAHLDRQKSKYYEEIKAGSKLTKEQQKAVDFFNRYNKESKESEAALEKQTNTFKLKLTIYLTKTLKVLTIMLVIKIIGLMLRTQTK